MTIRPAGGGDVAAIDALLRHCFPAPAEAVLVRDLCIEGDMLLTLVADDAMSADLAGLVAFSRMAVTINDRPVAAAALAPIAVDPAWRHRGVADALIAAGLEHLEAAGIVLCFVLGDPAFYGRFGFAADIAAGFSSPYAGEHFMALPLQGGLIPCGVRGNAAHAAAFARLGTSA
ncbi:GNAT family N-acetyltransferase [Sphingomonas insulae]|uniref:N-acetyltransferase n=1 Tax=Sphingomonas insulae TaxID=424800 RepID=A0ABP3SVS2_9SPHN|nr:N-acetyltransferase [Sphingomonas insulae]